MAYEPCPYCFTATRVTWWDHAVGLSVECPSCRAHSGPPWTLRRLVLVALGSLFLNALVLFAVARPLKAAALIAFYAATVAALLLAATSTGSDAVLATAFVAAILGPACIAATEYIWHALDLERGRLVSRVASAEHAVQRYAAAPDDGPRFVGTAEMQIIRNELEIAIYHREEQLKILAYAAYATSAIGAVLAVIEKQWLEAAFVCILFGVAYTAAAHESRIFAVAYTLAGVALVVRFFSPAVGGGHAPGGLSLPFAAVAIGVGLTRVLFSIMLLRRIREQIPLGPAEHLQ